MEKDIIISLKGIQTNVDNKIDTIELMSEGKFYIKEGSCYIVYKESEITGMEGTTTTIKITNNVISIIRFGNVCSNLTFEKDKKNVSNYQTQFGIFETSVMATEIRNTITENGGELYIEYEVEVDGQQLGYNNFYIKIIEVK